MPETTQVLGQGENCAHVSIKEINEGTREIIKQIEFFSVQTPITIQAQSIALEEPFEPMYFGQILISDGGGIIYFRQQLLYYLRPEYSGQSVIGVYPSIKFGDCCSETELLVDSEVFPGWVCKPIQPISNSVVQMYQNLNKVR